MQISSILRIDRLSPYQNFVRSTVLMLALGLPRLNRHGVMYCNALRCVPLLNNPLNGVDFGVLPVGNLNRKSWSVSQMRNGYGIANRCWVLVAIVPLRRRRRRRRRFPLPALSGIIACWKSRPGVLVVPPGGGNGGAAAKAAVVQVPGSLRAPGEFCCSCW